VDRPDSADRVPPLVVVEADDAHCDAVRVLLLRAGWTLSGEPSDAKAGLVVWEVTVRTAEDASRAVLAAVDGAGLLVRARADRDITDRLCEDLRRIGALQHHTGDTPIPLAALIDDDQLTLLTLLSSGLTLGQAAQRLAISRRTADRRLAEARTRLGVLTTAQAVRVAREAHLL
jgi:DNA-binding CsgD family transcriptional regulator